jgi:hypothetical protein
VMAQLPPAPPVKRQLPGTPTRPSGSCTEARAPVALPTPELRKANSTSTVSPGARQEKGSVRFSPASCALNCGGGMVVAVGVGVGRQLRVWPVLVAPRVWLMGPAQVNCEYWKPVPWSCSDCPRGSVPASDTPMSTLVRPLAVRLRHSSSRFEMVRPLPPSCGFSRVTAASAGVTSATWIGSHRSDEWPGAVSPIEAQPAVVSKASRRRVWRRIADGCGR